MTAAEVLAELVQLGIQVEAHEDRLRYHPRSAVMPDLADRMKAHKRELLAIARVDATGATSVWRAALNRLEGDPLFPPDVIEELRGADVRWESSPDDSSISHAGMTNLLASPSSKR